MAKKKKQRTSSENYTISRKIEQLQSEGIRRDRATAAAFRMHREGELQPQNSPTQTPSQRQLRSSYKENILAGYIAIRAAKKRAQRRQRARTMKRK